MLRLPHNAKIGGVHLRRLPGAWQRLQYSTASRSAQPNTRNDSYEELSFNDEVREHA